MTIQVSEFQSLRAVRMGWSARVEQEGFERFYVHEKRAATADAPMEFSIKGCVDGVLFESIRTRVRTEANRGAERLVP